MTRLATIPLSRIATVNLNVARPATVDTVGTPRLRGKRWTALRVVVQRKCKSLCVDCGRLWVLERDHIDHVVELADGGTNHISNLVCRCLECHRTKSARSIAERGV